MRWRSPFVRLLLVAAGGLTIAAGLFAWSHEAEYGDRVYEENPSEYLIGCLYTCDVYHHDQQTGENVAIVEDLTERQAEQYLERLGRNYTVPAVVLVLGGVLATVGLWPERESVLQAATPDDRVSTAAH